MPKKQKTVHCKITFDESGNVVKVRDMVHGTDGTDVQSSPLGTIPNPVGECKVIVTADDDPCVIQGTTKWCW